MELVKKVLHVFMRSFTKVVLLLMSVFLLMMIMPHLSNFNSIMLPNVDQNHLCEATLAAGAFLFLAIMINRLQHYVGELCVRRKELAVANKRIKQLESARKEVNDAEANTIAQSKQLFDENQALKNQMGLWRARLDDLETEIGTRAKETITLCNRIKQQESELGTKMNEKTTLCRKNKQLESELEAKTKEITILGTRVKQLEFELETKAEESQETNVLGARLEQQLECKCKRETKEKVTSAVNHNRGNSGKAMLDHKRVDSSNHQKNQVEGPLADEFDRLLDGNDPLKNQLRSLTWRLSH